MESYRSLIPVAIITYSQAFIVQTTEMVFVMYNLVNVIVCERT